MDRHAWLTEAINPDRVGLEIGPLDRAIVSRQSAAVRYADHLDQASLRRKYADHAVVDGNAIPVIDYVIDERGIGEAVAGQRFAYVVASHVIEHVPDPIGWLVDIQRMLDDGGVLLLAIPDMRRCFDALRRESTAGEWIEARLMEHRRPSPSRLFDALANEVKIDGAISWHHDPDPLTLVRSRTPEETLSLVLDNLESGVYLDVHCWAFVPESFCNLMRMLVLAGLVDLSLDAITPTIGHEFLVRLKRDDAAPRWQKAASYPAAGGRYDDLPPDFDAVGYCRANPDVAAARVDPNDHYLQHGRGEGRPLR